MEDVEQFAISIIRKIARGNKVEYSESQKSFVIRRNNWFVRTIPLFMLMEAWEMRT